MTEYVFLFRDKRVYGKFYYVVEHYLYNLMLHCEQVRRVHMLYMGCIPLDQVNDINKIQVPAEKGDGYYLPLSDFPDTRQHLQACNRCTSKLCGVKERPIQNHYTGRKLSRYPGRAGEENDDE